MVSLFSRRSSQWPHGTHGGVKHILSVFITHVWPSEHSITFPTYLELLRQFDGPHQIWNTMTITFFSLYIIIKSVKQGQLIKSTLYVLKIISTWTIISDIYIYIYDNFDLRTFCLPVKSDCKCPVPCQEYDSSKISFL